MSDSESAANFVLKNEWGLLNDPHDHGGIKNHGISLRFLKSIPSERLKKYSIYVADQESIKSLTTDKAKSIYKGEFWDNAPFEKIVNQYHCNYIFYMAIKMGISPAIKAVQRACWAVMKDWEKLVDDGILGEKTLSAITIYGFLIIPALKEDRENHYRNMLNNNADQKRFLRSWYNSTYHQDMGIFNYVGIKV